jgi:hypothetical protein
MSKLLWRGLAWLCSREAVANYLIKRAQETPYSHIHGKDGVLYMSRWWLFNPYPKTHNPEDPNRFPISVRVHHIAREDDDRHLHDHPWNARTIILRGGYTEVREDGCTYYRGAGSTARLNFGEYHRITSINKGGAYTLFISGQYQGTWGFKVDGVKIPWRKYLGVGE